MTKEEKLQILNQEVTKCTKCKELVESRVQTVFGNGNCNSKVLFLGEAPGRDESEQGQPFVGRAGKLLDNMLQAVGINRKDVYVCNIVKCRPPGNRVPSPEEACNCAPFLNLQIKIVNPKFIICLGNTAVQNLLKIEEPIGKLRGKWFDYKDAPVDAKLLPIWHPAYVLRNSRAKEEMLDDLKLLVEKL